MKSKADNPFSCQRGVYDPLRFVLRLRPDMWKEFQGVDSVTSNEEVSRQVVEAYSIYLHETIHWWQHIGTTAGLVLSLNHSVKTTVTHQKLRSLVANNTPQKSLLRLNASRDNSLSVERQQDLDTVLNRWHSLEFHSHLTLRPASDPQLVDGVIENPYFESFGHSLHVALADTLSVLAAMFDRDHRVMPDSRRWDSEFIELDKRKVEGFYRGSPVGLSSIGAKDIFEAQARFVQLQYLYLSNDRRLSWNEFGSRGFLSSAYTAAFKYFRLVTGAQRPKSPVSPEVQLFLLLCDLALNPGDGYPFDLLDPQSCLLTNDPGIRFSYFCTEVAKHPSLLRYIRKCSHQEYLDISMLLCQSMLCRTPIEICAELVRWSTSLESLDILLQQEASFSFPNENLPVRICFAKHLRFVEDKLSWPHLFCWPAMFLVNHGMWDVDLVRTEQLFRPHLPLFVGDLKGEIQLALPHAAVDDMVVENFNDFYRWVIQYDLLDQWMAKDGPFDLDFTDIHPALTPDIVKPLAETTFFEFWGVSLDDFVVIGD
jgi:hypothetical protein